MKRRDFLGTVILGSVIAAFSGILNKAHAAVVWVADGKLGYKTVADAKDSGAGKTCATCGWYKAGGTEKGAGLCTLTAMQGAMKSKEIYVKDGAHCLMWKKKA